MKNIITVAVFTAATFTATTASAFTAKDCPSIAEAAGALAQGRDDGLSLSTSKVIVRMADFPFAVEYLLLEITGLAFETPELTPAIMEALTLHTCVDHFSTGA